ncbi:MAG: sulfite exporter TauE/SafE family protein [Chthoniobacteraceae bacterium]
MLDFSTTLQAGPAAGWFFFPTALLLGALHGLEPGHSKTMMAALIIAIRGTAWQAALLGLSAAFSHTLVIWVLAALGIYFGGAFRAEDVEPYFQTISAAFILCFAGWMFLRTRENLARAEEHEAEHGDEEFQDDHEREHARELQARLGNRTVTTPQIVMFGLTGGLMPCPAALSVLLICLQLERFSLGFALVGAFSIGLAATLVAAGMTAAWSVRMAGQHLGHFSGLLRRAPYLSCAVLGAVGIYIGWRGATAFW